MSVTLMRVQTRAGNRKPARYRRTGPCELSLKLTSQANQAERRNGRATEMMATVLSTGSTRSMVMISVNVSGLSEAVEGGKERDRSRQGA